MAYLGRDGDGVHPPIPATHLAQRLSACALLWLAERGGPRPLGAYPGAPGLDRSNPASSHSQPGTALSSLRRPVVLGGHADPRPSLTLIHVLPSSPQAQFRRPGKSPGKRQRSLFVSMAKPALFLARSPPRPGLLLAKAHDRRASRHDWLHIFRSRQPPSPNRLFRSALS